MYTLFSFWNFSLKGFFQPVKFQVFVMTESEQMNKEEVPAYTVSAAIFAVWT